eukprot:CAMPEP_0182886678 /NCGR_PEP_ID=MMETSP0034_2-20130328/20367_1 /TAXON_ID=156128 /ORGANISM="Nephroselmis pyriformis, Strain CCMP717" /LENGTH=96 /DNA_ID=CAMNT_0025020017 /DNA_START=29 /DNA_END=315 /DNA_ORIENTATION=-
MNGQRFDPLKADDKTAKAVVTVGIPALLVSAPWILTHPTVLSIPGILYITPSTRKALGPLTNACARVIRRRLNSSWETAGSERGGARWRPPGEGPG